LSLIFVELSRVKTRHTIQSKRGILPRIIRDLKTRKRTAHEQRNAAGRIDDIGKIAEELQLLRSIMDRVATARGIFDAEIVAVHARREKRTQLADGRGPTHTGA